LRHFDFRRWNGNNANGVDTQMKILYDPKRSDPASLAEFIENCPKVAIVFNGDDGEIYHPFTAEQRQTIILALRAGSELPMAGNKRK
jgi:hypothetical protein